MCRCADKWQDLAPLLLRVAIGVVFVAHGYQKIFDMGIGNFAGFLSQLNVPLPLFFAYVVSYVELLGGVALILGFLTHWASKLLAINMLAALFLVHITKGIFVSNGGYEFVLVLLAGAISLMITGAGKWSVDARFTNAE